MTGPSRPVPPLTVGLLESPSDGHCIILQAGMVMMYGVQGGYESGS